MSSRKGELVEMTSDGSNSTLIFHMPSANFVGIRSFLRDISKGSAIFLPEFLDYRPVMERFRRERNGVLVASAQGIATAFSLEVAQTKGTLFINEGEPVYEGMIIGESQSLKDMDLNVIKAKPITGMRSKIHVI